MLYVVGFVALIISAVAQANSSSNADFAVVEKGYATPTIYYISTHDETRTTCSVKRNVLDPQGKVIINVCEATYDSCSLQGSCVIIKGQQKIKINFHSQISGTNRFFQITDSKCPYAWGFGEICVDPYYSVAADLKHYKLGDVLFVPKAVGLILPDGTRHSGYFIIRDRGGGIIGKGRFDFFTGFLHPNDPKNPLTSLGLSDPKNSIQYALISGPRAEQFRKNRKYPLVP